MWFALHPTCSAQDLRLAIVGTDSSHAVAFTRILNDDSAPDHVARARIVAAFRGGNPSLVLSRNRIETFSSELTNKWSIPFVSAIRDLCSQADGILILSVDPSLRLREFEQAASCHKPIFVDKPAARDLHEVEQMARLARRLQVPWFSSSALRFVVPKLSGSAASVDVWGPGDLGKVEEGYPLDLAWYGIHSIEALSSAMGPGMAKASRAHTKDTDIITFVWSDGRTGTVHLIRPDAPFSIRVRLSSGEVTSTDLKVDYAPLLQSIVTFFRTQTVPVSVPQTLEIFTAMHAAQESMRSNGSLVAIEPAAFLP